MRPRIILLITYVFVCAPLWAAPPQCVTGTLASYIRLGAEGCTYRGVNYANFGYSTAASGGAATIAAGEIAVTPEPGVVGESNLGFSAPWQVAKGQTLESILRYTAAILPCDSSSNIPIFMSVGLDHSVVSGIIGAVTVDHSTNVGDLEVFVRCEDSCQSKASALLSIHAVSVLLITDHVSLNGGTDGASLSGFGDSLNLCPVCA